jgi:hypothetical protein
MGQKVKQEASWFHPSGAPWDANLLGQVFFPFDVDRLDARDTAELDLLADYAINVLLSKPRLTIRCEGHADSRGSAEYNYGLGLRRANAVKRHLDSRLKAAPGFHSTTTVSFGEKQAAGGDVAWDRRVDLIACFYGPQRIVMPPVEIEGKIPDKFVRRPVQIFDIEMMIGISYQNFSHTMIAEKMKFVPRTHTYPHNQRYMGRKRHKFFPRIEVSRFAIDWRKPTAADTAKKFGTVALELLLSAFSGEPVHLPSGGIPKLKLPNLLYGSWDDYTKGGTFNKEFLQYRNRPLR